MDRLEQTVHIVDDDAAVRDSLELYLRTAGLKSTAHASAEEFLQRYRAEQGGCLILDVHMPDMSGMHLQQELLAVGSTLPVIFVTGHADVSTAVQALKAGAVDFIEKPFDNLQLLGQVNRALELDRHNRARLGEQTAVRERLLTLTPRETNVLDYLLDGAPTKVIAIELELSHRTVEIYRANVMQKMQSRSIAQLVKMVGEFHAGSQ